MSKEKLKNKGITLIALIITVVVALVLAGVALNVILGDEGVINNAKEAKIQMQIESDKEELLSAVVAATGKSGKVDFAYLDNILPAGFTGSNGVYTSKNGYVFIVTENGKVTYSKDYEGDINVNGKPDEPSEPNEPEKPNIEDIEIDLNGKYYMDYAEESYIEFTNYTTWYDSSYKESYPMEMTFDKETKSGTIKLYRYYDGNTLELGEPDTYTFTYEVAIKNYEVVNKVIFLNYEGYVIPMWTDKNEFEYDLDGAYVNNTGTLRFLFNANTGIGERAYYSSELNKWYRHSGDEFAYASINGKHFIMGGYGALDVSEDLNTLTFNGKEYTKKANSTSSSEMVSVKSVAMGQIGSGDKIIGFNPNTGYTSSNPYNVSLAGCSGSFYTEKLEWTVISWVKNTITMKANGVTTQQLTLKGANGWNNGTTALNDVCSAIYSGSTDLYTATAESVNFNDLGISTTPSSNTYNATTGVNNKFPISYLKETQGLTDVAEDTTGCGYTTNSNITVTNTGFTTTSDPGRFANPYWVDKKCVVVSSATADRVGFSIGWVIASNAGNSVSEAILFDSSGTENEITKSIRPYVTLKKDSADDWSCLYSEDGATWVICNESF